MPDDRIAAAVADIANAAAAIVPITAHMRKAIDNLLDDARRLESSANRLARALTQLQPPTTDAS